MITFVATTTVNNLKPNKNINFSAGIITKGLGHNMYQHWEKRANNLRHHDKSCTQLQAYQMTAVL